MTARVFVLVLFALASTTWAQVVPPPTGYQGFVAIGRDAAASVIRQAAANDIALGVTGGAASIGEGAVNVAVSGSRLIGYGGAVAVSSAVIGAGLSWYMQQAQNAIDGQAPTLASLRDQVVSIQDAQQYAYCNVSDGPYAGPNYRVNCYGAGFGLRDGIGGGLTALTGETPNEMALRITQQAVGASPIMQIISSPAPAPDGYINGSIAVGIPASCDKKPSVSELMNGYYDSCHHYQVPPNDKVVSEARKVAIQYITEHPPTPAELAAGRLGPGVALTPAPNPNQVSGQPDDPTVDTDKDGATDQEEVRQKTDPNDPKSKPGVAGTKTTTVRNPDGSTTKTTETTHPDGSKDKVSETVKREVTTTDATIRTRTTTTTTSSHTTPTGEETTMEPVVKVDETEIPNPNPTPKEEAPCTAGGGTWNPETSSCTPKPPKECPEGQIAGANDTCELPPAGDTCGDFSVPRLLQHTGSYLKDVVFPCDSLDWGAFRGMLADKFPFSIALAVNSFMSGSTGGGASNPLPTKMGPFEMDFSFAGAFLAFVKGAFRTILWVLFFRWLLDRVAGQVVLS